MTRKTKIRRKTPPDPHFIDRWRQAQPVFGLVLERARDGIVLQNITGTIEWINPACEKMFGWSLEELRGRKAWDFVFAAEDRPPPSKIAEFRYDLNSSLFHRYEVTRNLRRDGTRFWNQQSFAALDLGPAPDQKKVVITCRDVTDQVNTEAELRQVQVDLEHAAHHDDLTGLANRKKLGNYMRSDRVIAHIQRGDIGVLQVDVDKFKDINDTLGHAAGDATLVHVASALRVSCGPHDLVCRTGGDEFLVICLNTPDRDTLMVRARALLGAISAPLQWEGQSICIGSSIGASLPAAGTVTGEAMIQQADQALYAAKNLGRGQVVLYTDELGHAQMAQLALTQDLHTALAEKQFEVYLQPQLDLPQNRVTGCEALIRWNHPQRGVLPPGAFLNAAEKAGILPDVDYISMNLALDALVSLRAAGFHDMAISINVSCSILADVNYPGLLDWALQSRDISPRSVCIEILETTILEGGDLDIVTAVHRLQRLGVRVALDDFGTGYAGLSHMTRFEIDAIKLDRSMICRLDSDPRNRIIVRSIIRLCGLLGMQCVAEGVETRAQLEMLRRAKCPVIQGFGLARPMPVGAMVDWLHAHTPVDLDRNFDPAPTSSVAPLSGHAAE